MKTLALVTTLTAALLSTSLAQAGGTRSPLVDKREQHQVQRLKNGIKSGALTGKEALRSMGDQVRIRRHEKHFKSDGNLTGKERAKLHRALNHSGRRLHQRKHNARTR